MTRQFLTDPAPATAQSAAAPAQAQAPVPAQAQPPSLQKQPGAYQDALAGAFPEWDLLPASPFIRRVK